MSRNDHASFVALFVKNQRRIYGYILTVVPNCNEADDLFQQTSLVLWEKAAEFRPEGDFVRWACGVALNVIRNYRVKKRRDRHWFSYEMMARIADVRAEKSEWLDRMSAALGACMDELAPFDRELLVLVTRASGRSETCPKTWLDRELRPPALAPNPASCSRASSRKARGSLNHVPIEPSHDRLRDYAERYCDGMLSAEETAVLERQLRDDPQALVLRTRSGNSLADCLERPRPRRRRRRRGT